MSFLGSNILSISAQRSLSRAATGLSVTLERLTSGQRINRAADDAAGLSISNRLKADSVRFGQAIRNINDGVSYLSLAESGIGALQDIVSRVSELAGQAANGSYTDNQRKALQNEARHLANEYNRILDTSSFNGQAIFLKKNGEVTISAGFGASGSIKSEIVSQESRTNFYSSLLSISTVGEVSNSSNVNTRTSISADGRYAVFMSMATNLIPGVSGPQIYRKDLLTGTLELASSGTNGQAATGVSTAAGSISADGRYVVFQTNTSDFFGYNNVQIYRKDMLTGELKHVSGSATGTAANGTSTSAAVISADGKYVAFETNSNNLVTGASGNQVYRKNMDTGEIAVVSSSSLGLPANTPSQNGSASISADGRYVAFQSTSTSLMGLTQYQVYRKDLLTGELLLASSSSSGTAGSANSVAPFISADGKYVVFNSLAGFDGSPSGINQIYRKNLETGEILIVSASVNGQAANSASTSAAISADGRYVIFRSNATNLTEQGLTGGNLFVKDLTSGRISGMQIGGTTVGSISSDGRYIMAYATTSSPYVSAPNALFHTFSAQNPLIDQNSASRLMWFDLSTQAGAIEALEWFKSYSAENSAILGKIGATLSRFDSAVNSLSSMRENYKAAESRIMDADIAGETASLTRMSIIKEAATAVLAQANSQPLLVLKLLKVD